MRGFLLGLLVGAAVGAAGLYLWLERPWGRVDLRARFGPPDAGAREGGERRADRRRRGRRGQRRRGAPEPEGGGLVELTPAQREPAWRGPAVRPPERTMDFGEGGGGRTLDQGEIDRGIASGKDAVIRCITESRGNAELVAEIKLVFLVGAGGDVGKLRIRAPSYLLENGLYGCVKRAVRSMRFPATGAPTVVRVPFDLS